MSGDGSFNLLDRALGSGHKRLAVISLHPGAGARTVVETLALQLRQRGAGIGVTSVPRINPSADDADQVTGLNLPEGAVVATAASVLEDSDGLQQLEHVDCPTPLGRLCLCKVTRSGEVPVYGPDDAPTLDSALTKLEAWSRDLVLVGGAWERHSFAAPEVTQAVIVAVGTSYSGTPDRSAAAVRYVVEVLGSPRGEIPADRLAREAAASGMAIAVDRNGTELTTLSPDHPEPGTHLELLGDQLAAVVLPEFLSDGFLMRLVRTGVRCTLVVKDATRIRVSPVYHTAWLKGGGGVAVINPIRVLAVTTNPSHPSGPDADALTFRNLVAEAVPNVPVHDVRLESAPEAPQPAWKFWA